MLTVDARGHGASGGLVTIDGPREIADVRDAFGWLAARPDVADKRIGAWGISYGGGALWNALVAGVPFAAAETCETWTDLYSALVPQNLSKSGAVTGFLSEIPPGVLSPALETFRAWALTSSNLPALRVLSAERSALPHLRRVTTPVFMMQGRRDFAFGIDQATRAYSTLAGPKALWIGNHGHAPSTLSRRRHRGDDGRRQDVVRPLSPRPAGGHRATGARGARGDGRALSASASCLPRRR